MKVKLVLWKHNVLKDGTHPIKLKVTTTSEGKTLEKYHPTGCYSKESQWNEDDRRVNAKHPNMQAVNIKLSTLLLDIQNQAIKDDDVNMYKVGGGNIVNYWEKILKEIKVKHSALYYNSMHSVKEKFKAFNENLTFQKLKNSDIRDFETYLINLGNGKNTIHHNLKRLKFITSLAVKDGILEYHKNPFIHIKLESANTKKTRLPYNKIIEINNLDLPEQTPIWHTRNYWLFSFYCAGIRFGDFCRLKKTNIKKVGKDYRLFYTMNKTTKNRNILLIDEAVDILNLYKDNPTEYLFGIIPKISEDKFKQQAQISRENASANKYLKKLEKMVVSDIKLSFHSSRHSFADYAKKNGLDIHTIKELLGHDKITTTEIYLNSFFEEETDSAMRKMFKK